MTAGRSVLVLEDEPIIALDLEEVLEEAGFEDVQVFSSCADASTWLEANTPQVGILDPRVRDGVCTSVAQTLLLRSVPFIVYSGQAPDLAEDAANVFSKGAFLSKPCHPQQLLAAIATKVTRTG
ncbi:UNVERIFIED_ORG: DNA-binding response OmpR family regulator [Ensifer adhaerens]|nr:DNA-binding response OmpR family regulator [Ensifer adhaerens]